jgi:arginyl-tRNA synthetase
VGDDIDRPLIKSDGSYTYFAADVAYFKDKYDRGFDEMIYVLGADHGGYVKRLEAVARAVSEGKAKLTVLLCQLVKLFRNGEPVKMSKRSGDFVTLREVVEEVGRDSVRFMMLYRKNSEPLDFDFAKVTEQSKDNPVFYVQYAHARCMSVFRQAAEAFPDLDVASLDLAGAIAGNIVDRASCSCLRSWQNSPVSSRVRPPRRSLTASLFISMILPARSTDTGIKVKNNRNYGLLTIKIEN